MICLVFYRSPVCGLIIFRIANGTSTVSCVGLGPSPRSYGLLTGSYTFIDNGFVFRSPIILLFPSFKKRKKALKCLYVCLRRRDREREGETERESGRGREGGRKGGKKRGRERGRGRGKEGGEVLHWFMSQKLATTLGGCPLVSHVGGWQEAPCCPQGAPEQAAGGWEQGLDLNLGSPTAFMALISIRGWRQNKREMGDKVDRLPGAAWGEGKPVNGWVGVGGLPSTCAGGAWAHPSTPDSLLGPPLWLHGPGVDWRRCLSQVAPM